MPVALANAYATNDELEDYLDVDGGTEDDLVNGALNTASRLIDRVCRRSFIVPTGTSARTYRPGWRRTLEIVDVIADISLAVTLDLAADATFSTTWTLGTEFDVDEPEGELHHLVEQWPVTQLSTLAQDFPLSHGARRVVKVTGNHGWPATPAAVRQATLMFAARLFRRRESTEGVLTVAGEHAIRVANKLDPDAMAAISEYRLRPVMV